MPRPPAWVTAAASLPPAAEPIGASRMGCWITSSRVSAVSIVAMMNSVQPTELFLHADRAPEKVAHPHDGVLLRILVVLDAMAMRHIPRVGADERSSTSQASTRRGKPPMPMAQGFLPIV